MLSAVPPWTAAVCGGVGHVIQRIARAVACQPVADVADLDDQARRIFDRVDPMGASEEWQVLPRTVTLNERLPLWPITTPISVGSPTKQAAGFTLARPRRAISRVRRRSRPPRHRRVRGGSVAERRASMSGTAARQQASRSLSCRPRRGRRAGRCARSAGTDRWTTTGRRREQRRCGPRGCSGHALRPDRRPQVGFGAGFIGDALMRHPEPVEIGLDPFN